MVTGDLLQCTDDGGAISGNSCRAKALSREKEGQEVS